ncbi:alpha/beta fold hydrolase [uncultured Anaerococcus sp.]|uniref:alpha/beta fold hydrolase n=1 Tax=uncultured Anaerococcus sp. TaxID=293428 RepID=UPI0026315B8D|nr:alpha/beta fold hydrolase [uncultured Anaerococcus sp.]
MKIFFIILIILIIPQLYYLRKEGFYKSLAMTSKYFKRLTISEDKNHEELYLTNTDGNDIFVKIYKTDKPKGLVQLVHGMSEHGGNYDDFANFLADNGYIVAIADHRGHGRSISNAYPNGFMQRAEELIDDQAMLSKYLKAAYPDQKLFMLGHSMGSMIARLYLRKNDKLIDKLILTGTVPGNAFAPVGVFFLNILCFYFGENHESQIIDYIVGAGKGLDFISFNEENIKNKENDPMRIFKFKLGYSRALIELNQKLTRSRTYELANPNLKIYNLVGESDPITKGEKGIKSSLAFLNNLGYKNINSKVYKDMKHEILNETDKKIVYEDILNILDDKDNLIVF